MYEIEIAALALPQRQRLSRLRERHYEIAVKYGPGGTLEAAVHLSTGVQYSYLADADKLLDRVEEVIEADPDG